MIVVDTPDEAPVLALNAEVGESTGTRVSSADDELSTNEEFDDGDRLMVGCAVFVLEMAGSDVSRARLNDEVEVVGSTKNSRDGRSVELNDWPPETEFTSAPNTEDEVSLDGENV